MYRLGITFISTFILSMLPLIAQQPPETASIDSITYQQYLQKDYQKLIETSKKARARQIGFYYLDYRTAIAYFELKNYANAARYYRKTLEQNPGDPVLLESLYYAYLLSGQKTNANIVARSLPPHVQATIGYSPQVVDYISISGGYSYSGNTPELGSKLTGLDSLNLYRNMAFASLGIGINLSGRSKLLLGYQRYNNAFERHNASGLLYSNILSQHQLNLVFEFFTGEILSCGLAGGYYSIDGKDKPTKSSAYAENNGTGVGRGFIKRHNLFSLSSSETDRASAFSALAFINKRWTYLMPEIAVAWSNFGGWEQYQAKGSLTYYPLGNLNFYGTTSMAAIFNSDSWVNNQFIVSQHLGCKLARQLWLEGSAGIGNHLNYISNHSFMVYDTYDAVKALAGLTLSWYITKAVATAGYQWQQREGYASSITRYLPYKYNNHLINISFSWNF
ncbi:tetratricopeptide repeat protein [Proteiniphilum sp. UBA5375]|uniref:tetratricopeptide repeat protein n=1 Tax=Proteiniphilum sp. UBA5375 TaxID=1947278 RepID=UPI00257D232C|nr:hypothetical protein [Proteiniphilum sp. UBA5375]